MPRELTSMEERKRLALGLPPIPKEEPPVPDFEEQAEEVVMLKEVVGEAPPEPEPEELPEIEAIAPEPEPEEAEAEPEEKKPTRRGRKPKEEPEESSEE